MCEAAGTINGTPGLNGLIDFEEYLKLFKIIVALQLRFSLKISEDNKVLRRAAVKKDDKPGFAVTTNAQLELTNKTKNGVHMSVCEFFEIEPELYDRCGRHAHEDPYTGKKMFDTATQIEIDEHRKIAAELEDYEDLDKATTLKHIEVLEMKKAQFMTGIYTQLEMGQFPESHLQMAQEMAKIQSLDAYYNEEGVSDIQISIAFKEHKLQETKEFGKIVMDTEKYVHETVSKALEAAGHEPRPMHQGEEEDYGAFELVEEEVPDFGGDFD